jgi:hypothetical protein
MLLVAALTLSKVSVVTLIRHIFTQDMKRAWKACNLYTVVVVAWGLMSVLALSVDCSSTSLLNSNQNEQCPNQVSILSPVSAVMSFQYALPILRVSTNGSCQRVYDGILSGFLMRCWNAECWG